MKQFQPADRHSVIPRIVTADPEALVRFVIEVFGASGDFHVNRPSEIRIGDSIVMISDGGGIRSVMPGFLYVYVEDVDAVYRKAVEAGAESLETPADQPYGDRRAMVRDMWGNLWQIASRNSRDR